MEKIDIFSPLLGNMMDIIVSDFDKSLQGFRSMCVPSLVAHLLIV